jgi:hypothetical protein
VPLPGIFEEGSEEEHLRLRPVIYTPLWL